MPITQEKFDQLLAWLDPDRDAAGTKYEEIRQSLIKILTWRGYGDAESMTDEVINRVAEKMPGLMITYQGDPALYFYGVAKRVLLEYQRQENLHVKLTETAAQEVDPLGEVAEERERMHECLAKCLQKLSRENREMVMLYYRRDKQEKIDERKEMAERIGVAANTLRVRMFRIRSTLVKCVKRCLESNNSMK